MTEDCKYCDHINHGGNGHCYMFKLAPVVPCTQNTNPVLRNRAARMNAVSPPRLGPIFRHAVINARKGVSDD